MYDDYFNEDGNQSTDSEDPIPPRVINSGFSDCQTK